MKLRTFTAKLKKAKGLSSQTKSNTKIRCWGKVDKGTGKILAYACIRPERAKDLCC